jgi:phosphoribosylformylglycinamidine synthase
MQLDDGIKDVDAHLKQMCEKLLANTVIEEYRYEIIK